MKTGQTFVIVQLHSSFHLNHLLEHPVDSRSQQQPQVPLMPQFSYVTHEEA